MSEKNNDEIENDLLMADKLYVAYKEHNDIVLKMSYNSTDDFKKDDETVL